MRVALINPPAPFLIDEMVMPPLGLSYLSAVLKQHGHEVEFINLIDGKELPQFEADVVGITVTTPQAYAVFGILSELRARKSKARVVIGGPHANAWPTPSLTSNVDAVVVGEGERAILDVVNGAGGIIHKPLIENLDELPFPDRSLVDGYHYSLNGKRATTMMTSRGCLFHCAFCCKATWGRTMRTRSSWNVLAEATELRSQGYEAIMCYDDEFLIDWERDKAIFNGFKELGMTYRIFTRSNLIDETKAQLLASTGCYEVLIGIESGSDMILRKIHKGTTRKENLAAIAILKSCGVRVKAALIVGLPGESWKTIQEMGDFVEESQPDDVDFTICAVYPGSPIWDHPSLYDISFPSEGTAYKTKPGEYIATTATSHMSSAEIVEARAWLEQKFKKW